MMRWVPLAFAALLPPASAFASCQSDTAAAMRRANELPPSAGRAALMEQIQRAEIAHHEGDEDDCAEQLGVAVGVLDSIDVAKKRAAAAHEATASKPRRKSDDGAGGSAPTK